MKQYKEEWWTGIESDGIFYCGGFDTLEEAIEDGIGQYKKALSGYGTDLFDEYAYYNDMSWEEFDKSDDVKFYVGKRIDFEPKIDAERIIDDVVDQAYDFFGEWYNRDYDYIKEDHMNNLEQELQKVYDEWADKYGYKPSTFLIEATREVFVKDYLSQSKE